MPRKSLQKSVGNPASPKAFPRWARPTVTTPVSIMTPFEEREHAARLIRIFIVAQLFSVVTLFVRSESMRTLELGVLVAVWLFRPKSCGIPYRFMLLVAVAFSLLLIRIEASLEQSGFVALAALIVFAVLFRNSYLGLSLGTGSQKFNHSFKLKPHYFLLGFLDAIQQWLVYGRHGTPMPGHYRSPAGSYHFRLALTIGVMILLGFPFYTYPQQLALSDEDMATLNPKSLAAIASFNLSYLLPLPLMLLTAFLASLTILAKSYAARKAASDDNALADSFYPMLEAALNSKDENERESILIGQLVHDKSPLWLPFESGMHLFLSGSTGAGKTAMTMRLLESVFLRRDVSLLVLDIKAFTHELYYTLEAVAEKVRSDERPVPFWRFTNRTGHSSHLFSIFHHDFWNNLTAEQRADILLNALAIPAGRSFGESWFGDSCYHILCTVFRKYPDITSFRELLARIEYELNNPKQNNIPKAVLQDGVHVQLIVNRLATLEQMNDYGQHPPEVTDNAIDLARLYKEPCIVYSSLAALQAPIGAGEIGRIQIETLLHAALELESSERRMNVIVLVDEAAQLLADNMKLCMQQARSTGTSFWISTQTVSDLQQGTTDLTSTVEGNTAAQLWFKSIDRAGIEQIERLSGFTTERFRSESVSNGPNGRTYNVGFSEQLIPRLKSNEVLHAASRQHHYICRIADNKRYARFDGLPVVATTGGFHITEKEYTDRKNKPWPAKTPDTITVGQGPPDGGRGGTPPINQPPSGPIVDTGTIGGSSLRERKRPRK